MKNMRVGLGWLVLSVALWANPLEIIFEERPPYVVQSNGDVSGLVASPLMSALKKAHVKYVVKEKPSKRHLYEIKANQKPLCAIGWFKNPERETFARYTQPLYQDRPMGILVHRQNQAVSAIQSIDELLTHSSLTMLAKKSYSYGTFVDDQIKKHGVEKREVGVGNVKMLTLIAKRRADYMFISYEEAHELLTSHPQKDVLRFIALKGMPEGNKRYLICSKKTDDALIQRINEQL